MSNATATPRWSSTEDLFVRLYDRLREYAHSGMRREVYRDMLQETGLVHETYLWLRRNGHARGWFDDEHFFRVACKAMRNILVDHARERRSRKRTPPGRRVVLDGAVAHYEAHGISLLEFDDALQAFASIDEEHARAVKALEMRFFGGVSEAEAARILKVSRRTIRRDLHDLKAWLYATLRG